MDKTALSQWWNETLPTAGLALKAFGGWVFLMIAGAVATPLLWLIVMTGGAPKIVRAVYSIVVILPIVVLFPLNAIVYLVLSFFGIKLSYEGTLYGAVKWIERKKLYSFKD